MVNETEALRQRVRVLIQEMGNLPQSIIEAESPEEVSRLRDRQQTAGVELAQLEYNLAESELAAMMAQEAPLRQAVTEARVALTEAHAAVAEAVKVMRERQSAYQRAVEQLRPCGPPAQRRCQVRITRAKNKLEKLAASSG